jgi:hypothetical protein
MAPAAPERSMKAPAPLALDFFPQARRPGWLGWGLLALGLAMSALELAHDLDARAELAEREAIVDRLRHQVARDRRSLAEAPPATPVGKDEAMPALGLAAQLGRDWPGLFAAVAGAGGQDILLTALSPDAGSGVLRLSAEASRLEAVFDYMGRLEGLPELADVQLLAYERSGGRFQFNLSARWQGRP